MAFQFKEATKSGVLLRMALDGITGGGKTFTLLEVLTYLADPKPNRLDRDTKGKVAVIDTERGSARKYANIFGFSHGALAPPFEPRRYIEAIEAAAAAEFPVLGIDSLSHAWEGQGGVLEMKDNASRRQGVNDFTAWRDVTPEHNALVNTILDYPGHVIVTMRSKMAYAMTEQQKDGQTRTKVEKLGLKPIQREGMEYEFDIVGDMTDPDTNTLLISKTRCPELRGGTFREPGPDFTQQIIAWLSDAEPMATSQEKGAIRDLFKELGDAANPVKEWAETQGITLATSTAAEAGEVVKRLEAIKDAGGAIPGQGESESQGGETPAPTDAPAQAAPAPSDPDDPERPFTEDEAAQTTADAFDGEVVG